MGLQHQHPQQPLQPLPQQPPRPQPQQQPSGGVKGLVTAAQTKPLPRGSISPATAARLVTTPAPGPDPSRGDARLAALVHGAFRAFLHWAHERALRLPDRYFAWLVAYLVHWTSTGLYGLPPPPVPDAELVEGLTRLVARFAADARRRAAAEQGVDVPEVLEGQLRAIERQLVEKALHESRALLSYLPLPPPSSSIPPDGKRSGPHSRTALTAAAANTGGSLVDRVASLDAPGKTLLDFWAPEELASVQQVCRRWRAWALPRAAEYFWNLLICQCWWATFPSLDMARGCCLLEFLRRDATFSESLHASHSQQQQQQQQQQQPRNPLLLPDTRAAMPLPISPALGPLPPAPRIPPPPAAPTSDNAAAGLAEYLGAFRVAVDVMDQSLQAILASAVIELGDAGALELLCQPIGLEDDQQQAPQQQPTNHQPTTNAAVLLQGPTGQGLGAWRFKSHACADQYFAAGHEAFRMEVMAIHAGTHKVAMLLPSDERAFPPLSPVAAAALGLPPTPQQPQHQHHYTVKRRGERGPTGRRQMVVGTFHGVPAATVPGVGHVELGFELLVETQEEGGAEGKGQQVTVTVPRVGLVVEVVCEEGEGGEGEAAEGDDELSLPSLPVGAAGLPQHQQAQQPHHQQQQQPHQQQQQQQQQRRAKRRRLAGAELLTALGYLVPRLMWH